MNGSEGHAHVDNVSNDADYVLTAWTPGVHGHAVHWYIDQDGDFVTSTGTPTANERRVLNALWDELCDRYALV